MRQLFVAVVVAGCGEVAALPDAPTVDAPPSASHVEVALIPATLNRDVDMLFVIDDSPSMLDKQTNLKNNFSKLVGVLNTVLIGDPCLEKPIALPAQCEAIDQDAAGDHPIAACTDTTTTNCFRIVEDALLCPAGQHQKLEVVRTAAPPADTWTSVKCAQ